MQQDKLSEKNRKNNYYDDVNMENIENSQTLRMTADNSWLDFLEPIAPLKTSVCFLLL